MKIKKEKLLAALKVAYARKDQGRLEKIGKQAITTFPKSSFGYAYLAEAYLMDQFPIFPNAEILLAKAMQLDDDNLNYKLRFAHIKEIQGQEDDAYIFYQQVLAKNETNLIALKSLGTSELYVYHNPELALDYFDKAIDGGATDGHLYALKAEAHSQLGQYEEALEAADIGLKGGFNASAAIVKLTTLEHLNRTDGAEELYKKLLALDADNFSVLFNYGKLLLETGNAAAAEINLKKSLDIMDDGHPLLRSMIGDALLKQGKYEEAIERYGECISADNSNLSYYESRSDARHGIGDDDGAIEDLNYAIRAYGDALLFVNPLVFKKAKVFMDNGNLDKAEAGFDSLRKNKGGEKFGTYGLGLIEHKKGNLKEAYMLLKIAAKKMKHAEAKSYIKKHFEGYQDEMKTKILKQQASNISNNAQSSFINKISGKLWAFKDLTSKKMQGLPEEIRGNVKKSLSVLSFLFTETGVLTINIDDIECMTYKINKETSNSLDLDFIFLDGSDPFHAVLKLNGSNLLFSREKDEWLVLKEQNLNTIPANIKDNFISSIKKDKTKYLGDKANSVINTLYK